MRVKEKKSKKKSSDEKKVPFSLVMKDTWLALRLSFKYAPFACAAMLFVYILDSAMGFLSSRNSLCDRALEPEVPV